MASRAVALAKEGHNQRAEAREVLQKVEKEMKAPDAMHDKVEHEKPENDNRAYDQFQALRLPFL